MNTATSIVVLAGLATLALTSGGCQGTQPPPGGLRTVKMSLGGRTFVLEVADTDATRERGLMYRESMPADHGMIFVFPRERMLYFYMANTKIPLDIVYVDANGQIVSIHQMAPYAWNTVSSDKPAKYAIELNQGTADKIGLKAGDKLTIPPDAQNPKE